MAQRQRTNAYWEKRSVERLSSAEKNSIPYLRQVKRMYNNAAKDTVKTVRQMYAGYYRKDKTFDKALLNSIVPTGDISKFLKDMEAKGLTTYLPDNFKGRMDRIEMINAQIWGKIKDLGQKETALTTESYRKTIESTYYKTIYDTSKGIGRNIAFSKMDDRTVNLILDTKFAGANYSSRVWKNTDDLADNIQEIIARAVATGQSQEKTIREVMDKFGTTAKNPKQAYYYASRLVRTETNYFENRAEIEAYKSMGIKKYQFVAVLDERTSDICREHDGRIYEVDDVKYGENAPPLHPNCRSTVAPYIGRDYEPKVRIARDPQTNKNMYVQNMSYPMWYKQYVEEGDYSLDKALSKPQVAIVADMVKNAIGRSGEVWNKYADKVKYRQLYYVGTPHYNPNTDGIYLDINKAIKGDSIHAPYSTIFHETGHAIDNLTGDKFAGSLSTQLTINNKTFSQIIKKEVQDKVKEAGGTEKLKKQIEKYLKEKKLTRQQKAAISDIFGGSTGNKVIFGAGHSVDYWNSRSRAKEAFAEFFAASLEEDKTSFNAMSELFPNTKAFYDKILEEMLK